MTNAAAQCSGLRFSPHGAWQKVPLEAVREQLRLAFVRWGLPSRLRVDNGWPWGSLGEFPTDLSLWLIGLGIKMHRNNPASPQENGVVERSQGTSARWCEPWTCQTPEELQDRLERMDRLYREVYPYQNRARCSSSRVLFPPTRRRIGSSIGSTLVPNQCLPTL